MDSLFSTNTCNSPINIMTDKAKDCNNFCDYSFKSAVDEEFKKFNFKCVYVRAGGFGPCTEFFYEVWKKQD